jgi:hypothetical protein
VALLPTYLAGTFGVIATFQLALGSASVAVAASVILLQPGGAPEVFWRLRIPFAPVTSLLVAAALLSAIVGGDDVHKIRTYQGPHADATADDRPDLTTLVDTWLRSGRSCAETLTGTEGINGTGLNVRPLLMYAAEGGGIRAAYWTTATIDLIAAAPSATGTSTRPVCRSAMLSSGASGGSVGLSITSVRDPGTAADAVRAISGPEALGAAADGLVLRDSIYAATGIPLPSLRDASTEGTDWSDRATLIEQAWGRAIPRLNRPFLRPADPEPPAEPVRRPRWRFGPAGALVINSTSTTTSCRALISQVSLAGSGTSDCAPGKPAAASTDLVQCTGQLRTATAALLTARFPYVTPSGVVDCDGVPNQIVDGGYAENTGVGTLVDILPRVLARVRDHNDCVLAGKPRPTGCAEDTALRTLVVPVLVYLDNGTGSDLVTRPEGTTLEALVPPITLLSAQGALYSARAQLERAHSLLATDQLFTADTEAAVTAAAAVDAWRGNQVAVVYQATRPTIAAPLGWMLSTSSIAAMDAALCQQDPVEDLEFGAAQSLLESAPAATTAPVDEPTSYGTIDDVRRLLPGGAPRCRP